MSNIEYYGEAKEVIRKSYGTLTVEEKIRNFFWLYKSEQVDGNGRIIDMNDDIRNDARLRATGVYDYFKYKTRLEQLWVTENDMRNYFPNVQFIEAGSTTAPELGTEPSIPDIQEASDKPKRSRRKPSVE